MIQLRKSLAAWGREGFEAVLRQEIEQLDNNLLPLQQALTVSSYATDKPVRAMIISSRDDVQSIHVRVGIFYSGIIMGCNCSDDPTPVDEQPEYCVIDLDINKKTAQARIQLGKEQ